MERYDYIALLRNSMASNDAQHLVLDSRTQSEEWNPSNNIGQYMRDVSRGTLEMEIQVTRLYSKRECESE